MIVHWIYLICSSLGRGLDLVESAASQSLSGPTCPHHCSILQIHPPLPLSHPLGLLPRVSRHLVVGHWHAEPAAYYFWLWPAHACQRVLKAARAVILASVILASFGPCIRHPGKLSISDLGPIHWSIFHPNWKADHSFLFFILPKPNSKFGHQAPMLDYGLLGVQWGVNTVLMSYLMPSEPLNPAP